MTMTGNAHEEKGGQREEESENDVLVDHDESDDVTVARLHLGGVTRVTRTGGGVS